jgi:hypothetical protein
MCSYRVLACALMTALMAGRASAQTLDQPALPRLRSSNPSIAALIARATEQSATFRGLIEAINASDGIVYVEAGECGHYVTACLVTVTAAGSYRVLWIKVDTRKADCALTASIGHELQHVVEILSDSNVRSGVEMFLYCLRMGRRGSGVNLGFETTAALDAGTAVRSELRTCQSPVKRD